jgi:HD-GYP domain-containing protein (c-di-GMP phosphodiesterase class II)
MSAAFSRAVLARDLDAPGHALRVALLAQAIGMRLGWQGARLDALRLGGRLHDVGKLALAESILRKRGPLTPEEREQIRLHPVIGARVVGAVTAARAALPGVLYHHERWDGAGYPLGRAGTRIPLEARVLAVADAFDAMTSDRPYRGALPLNDALAEVAACSGTQFDPQVAAAFLDAWEAGDLEPPLAAAV